MGIERNIHIIHTDSKISKHDSFVISKNYKTLIHTSFFWKKKATAVAGEGFGKHNMPRESASGLAMNNSGQ